MELLLIRHAIAEERGVGARADDRERSLTTGGAERFRRIARVLATVWGPPDLVLASPYARAWQTAQLLEQECGWAAPEACPELEPMNPPATVLVALRGRTAAERVVLVGHEPLMHGILSLLLGGSSDAVSLEMKKGGAALVRCDTPPVAGTADLIWLLPPRVLLAVDGD
ncbi:MAG: histidine phosphatase family protein [Candidatus Latescibacteria bacterium]|nr:histidine phosphatase family protein [Candidatus Latescibacterota bacterium]